MMKKRVITWTLLVALTAAVPAFGIFGIPSPEDLLIWFVLRPIMHGNQRAMIANQIEQLRQLVEQLQTARSQLTHVTDSVQGLVGPIADPIADLVRSSDRSTQHHARLALRFHRPGRRHGYFSPRPHRQRGVVQSELA